MSWLLDQSLKRLQHRMVPAFSLDHGLQPKQLLADIHELLPGIQEPRFVLSSALSSLFLSDSMAFSTSNSVYILFNVLINPSRVQRSA